MNKDYEDTNNELNTSLDNNSENNTNINSDINSDINLDINSDINNEKKITKKQSTVSRFIRTSIMLISAIVFIYSSYMLIKIYLEYKQGEDIYKDIATTVLTPVEVVTSAIDTDTPEVEEAPPFKYDHKALLDINPEGVGFIFIPSVNVQLPIAQGTDNEFYLTHTFNRTYNGAGAIFEDYRIEKGLSSTHVILYGHNMKNGSMFAGVNRYLTPSFYQTAGNDIFYIYTENKLRTYKIFSAYISEPISNTYTYNFSTISAMREYANTMKSQSFYNTGVDISNATQIVTLSTCTPDLEKRSIIQGILINESTLE